MSLRYRSIRITKKVLPGNSGPGLNGTDEVIFIQEFMSVS
jgi:hypothetical protein